MPINKLKADILKRHASVHAFCKAHPELARASVYLLLSGKYPGNYSRQAEKIRAALNPDMGESPKIQAQTVSSAMMAETLQGIRCGNCRRLNRRECMACRDQTAREAAQLFTRLYGQENILEETER